MPLYSDPRLLAAGIIHGTTDRAAGNMRLAENTHTLFQMLDIPEEKILRFQQIHSDTIVTVADVGQARTVQQGTLPQADGWVISHCPGWGAAILTADCVPLILWDERAQVIGLAHSGWRGVAVGLPGKMVRTMRQAGAEGTLCAWVGPHIQNCCFEVQDDVAAQFSNYIEKRNNKLFVNLNQAILDQFAAEGLPKDRVSLPYYCTCGDKEHFFSYRRDHTKDALLTFVYTPPTKPLA